MRRGELQGLTLEDLWRGRARVELVCWKHGELSFSRDTLRDAMGKHGRYFPVVGLPDQGFCDGCERPGSVSIRDVRRYRIPGPALVKHYLDSRVEAICRVASCGESSFLDMKALAAKYGPDTNMDRVRAMLRCKGCGTKGKAHTIIRVDHPSNHVNPLQHVFRNRIEK